MRLHADASEKRLALDRELTLVARMKTEYPDIPLELAISFTDRLASAAYTPEAWAEAVEWLEATNWFQRSHG